MRQADYHHANKMLPRDELCIPTFSKLPSLNAVNSSYSLETHLFDSFAVIAVCVHIPVIYADDIAWTTVPLYLLPCTACDQLPSADALPLRGGYENIRDTTGHHPHHTVWTTVAHARSTSRCHKQSARLSQTEIGSRRNLRDHRRVTTNRPTSARAPCVLVHWASLWPGRQRQWDDALENENQGRTTIRTQASSLGS